MGVTVIAYRRIKQDQEMSAETEATKTWWEGPVATFRSRPLLGKAHSGPSVVWQENAVPVTQHEDANAKTLVPGCHLHPGLGSSLKMFSTHHPGEPDYDTCIRTQEWYLLHGSFCSSHRAGSPCGRWFNQQAIEVSPAIAKNLLNEGSLYLFSWIIFMPRSQRGHQGEIFPVDSM